MTDYGDRSVWESAERMHRTLGAFPKPIVAAVGGPAMGGGFDVAVQCDVRIAADDAVFGHPEIKFGAPTLFGLLAAVVGGGVARDLCLSGRGVDAQEALRIGLVTAVVPRERLLDEAHAYARTIADAPLPALRVVKQAIIEASPFKLP